MMVVIKNKMENSVCRTSLQNRDCCCAHSATPVKSALDLPDGLCENVDLDWFMDGDLDLGLKLNNFLFKVKFSAYSERSGSYGLK